jgi:serine protease
MRPPCFSRIHRIATLPSLLGALTLLGAGLLLPAAVSAERGPSRSSSLPTLVQSAAAQAEARVIVKFRSSSKAVLAAGSSADRQVLQQAGTLGTRHGLALLDGPMAGPRLQVIRASGMTSAALAARLATDSEVEYAVPDGRKRAHAAPTDPYFPGKHSGGALPQYVASINALTAWNKTTGNAEVIVAVLDTGIRSNHPEFRGKVVPGYDFVSDTNISNDSDGRDTDPADPGDWVTDAESRSGPIDLRGCDVSDSSWHGTQTAGLIGAATNNGVGISGIGRHVRIMPIRVLGKCVGHDSDILAGMRWAAGISVPGVPDNPSPAKVISMSLGSSGTCDSAYQAAVDEVRARGVLVVASAGNDSGAVNAPANCTGVVAVAGLRHIGTKNGYSSLGKEVTISAPAGNCVNLAGECLYPLISTSDTGKTSPSCPTYTGGGTDYAVGTSFSAPLVAGTLALMVSANPSLSVDEYISRLKTSSRAFPNIGAEGGIPYCVSPATATSQDECYCTKSTCGAGMLDAAAAVAATSSGRTIATLTDSTSHIALSTMADLSAASSGAASGHTITSRSWSLLEGLGIAGLTTNDLAATLEGLTEGIARVGLTVADSAGVSSTTSAVFSIGSLSEASCASTNPATSSSGQWYLWASLAAPIDPSKQAPGEETTSSQAGGGGSLDGASLAAGLIALAVLALRRPRRRS